MKIVDMNGEGGASLSRKQAASVFKKTTLALATLLLLGGCGSYASDAEPLAMADASVDLVATGRETYALYCVACHGAEGIAIDSPSNLFDAKWYHGESPSEIESTIREGILDKGMPPWGQMIKDSEIESVIAYLLSFQTSSDTNND